MPSHNHSAWTDSQGNHSHSIENWFGTGNSNVSHPSGYDTAWRNGTIWTDAAGNHTHGVGIGNTGSNQSHNNLQPYIAVYMWKRKS